MKSAIGATAGELVDLSLQLGNDIYFQVPTGSMFPSLAPGDQVLVRSVRAVQLGIGDMVVGKVGGAQTATQPSWFVHRLIGKRLNDGTRWLITKGDNASLADIPWSEAKLCGRVVAVRRRDSERVVSLLSRRARYVGAILALISRTHWLVQRRLHGWMARIASKIVRMTGYAFAQWGKWLIG